MPGDVHEALRLSPSARFYLRVAGSAFGVFWVWHSLRGIDWTQAGLFQNISWWGVAASFLLSILIYASRMLRLRHWIGALSPSGNVSITEWITLYLKSIAFGSFTPGRVGDLSRIVLMERTGLSLSQRSRVAILDKFTDMLYIPVGILLTAGVTGEKIGMSAAWIATGGGVMLAICLAALWRFGRFIGLGALAEGTVITAAGFVLFVASNVFLFHAVGINLSIADITAIILSVGLLASLPVSIGGLGVREGSLIAMLGIWGVDVARTPPLIAIELVMNMALPPLLYVVWMMLGYWKNRPAQNGHEI
ncbi:MAG: flippase-like domain-containing protein [Nitrospirae bacterium]|nr:flippase-like domain-containing protein [Nitrospirota bacterium]